MNTAINATIEEFTLTFFFFFIVKATAAKNENALQKLLESDEGACRLGEVALVPHSSPISQSGLSFYNLLIDNGHGAIPVDNSGMWDIPNPYIFIVFGAKKVTLVNYHGTPVVFVSFWVIMIMSFMDIGHSD